MTLVYYSLVRFIPDLERDEPVNVGAVFTFGDNVEVRFVERQDLLEGNDAIRRFEGLVRHLLESERSNDDAWRPADFLHRLAYRRFSHFEITEPRQMEPAEALPDALDGLTERLVQEPSSASEFAL